MLGLRLSGSLSWTSLLCVHEGLPGTWGTGSGTCEGLGTGDITASAPAAETLAWRSSHCFSAQSLTQESRKALSNGPLALASAPSHFCPAPGCRPVEPALRPVYFVTGTRVSMKEGPHHRSLPPPSAFQIPYLPPLHYNLRVSGGEANIVG